MSKSDNYRGISLCKCICKLFDVIIMKKCSHILHTSDQQFAFKANHSTTLCSGMLIESGLKATVVFIVVFWTLRRLSIKFIMEGSSGYCLIEACR